MDAILGPTPHRAVEVTGADRLSYLEAVLSQRVEPLEPGTATSALYLDVHGSPLAALDLAVLEERVVLSLPVAIADQVVAVLGSRTFLADARFGILDAEVARLRGEDADEVAAAAGLAVPAGVARAQADLVLIGTADGLDLVGPAPALEEAAATLVAAGARPVDADGLSAWEVAHGVPRWDTEIAGGHLPEELGLLATHVHLAKGCYPGQEAVARMWQLGRPRRRLAVVAVDDGIDAGWEAGTGRGRAWVTRVAEHDGRRVGLAFVPGDCEPGARFEDDEAHGITVERFVGEGRSVPGHDPAVARRRDRR